MQYNDYMEEIFFYNNDIYVLVIIVRVVIDIFN